MLSGVYSTNPLYPELPIPNFVMESSVKAGFGLILGCFLFVSQFVGHPFPFLVMDYFKLFKFR